MAKYAATVIGAVMALYAAFAPQVKADIKYDPGKVILAQTNSPGDSIDSKVAGQKSGNIEDATGEARYFKSGSKEFGDELAKYRDPEKSAYAVRWGLVVIPKTVSIVQEFGESIIMSMGIKNENYLCVFFKYKDNGSRRPYDGFQLFYVNDFSEDGFTVAEHPTDSTVFSEGLTRIFTRRNNQPEYEGLVIDKEEKLLNATNDLFKGFAESTLVISPPEDFFEIEPATKRSIKERKNPLTTERPNI